MLKALSQNIRKLQIYKSVFYISILLFPLLASGQEFKRLSPEASLYPTNEIVKRFDALSPELKREIFITLYILEHASLENEGVVFIVPDLVIKEGK